MNETLYNQNAKFMVKYEPECQIHGQIWTKLYTTRTSSSWSIMHKTLYNHNAKFMVKYEQNFIQIECQIHGQTWTKLLTFKFLYKTRMPSSWSIMNNISHKQNDKFIASHKQHFIQPECQSHCLSLKQHFIQPVCQSHGQSWTHFIQPECQIHGKVNYQHYIIQPECKSHGQSCIPFQTKKKV